MKLLLTFLLIAAVSAEVFAPDYKTKFGEEPIAFQFLKGFLKGLGEPKDVNDLLACVKDLEIIFEKIHDAIILIKQMTLQSIIEGIDDLIDAVNEFGAMIKPCSAGYTTLERLFRAIQHANIKAIVDRILKNAFQIIGIITNAVTNFLAKNYAGFGENIGALLKAIFLDSFHNVRGPRAEAFIKGLLVGIEETGDINKIMHCVKDIEDIIPMIKSAFEKIKTMKILLVIEGIKEMVEATRQIITIVRPCSDDLPVLKKLMDAFVHIDSQAVIQKALANAGLLGHLIDTALPCFKEENFDCVGECFGKILKILFL